MTAYTDGQVTLRSHRSKVGYHEAADLSGYQGVKPGDFVVHGLDIMRGSIGVADSAGAISSVCTVARPTSAVNARYVAYAMRQQALSGYPKALARGVREGGADFRRWDTLAELPIPAPPLAFQQAVVSFLDRETEQIDAFVQDQDVLIGLLQERRAAMISQAVLNMGEQQWPLRYLTTLNPSPPVSVRTSISPATFLPMDAIREFGAPSLSSERPASELAAAYSFIEDGDVAFAKVTPCFENGKGLIGEGLRNGRAFATTEVTVLRPSTSIRSAYLAFVLQSDQFRQGGIARMTGAGGLKRVPEAYARQFKVALPSLDRQDRLVLELNDTLGKLDAAIWDARRSISLSRERRASLISAAVAGRIAGRNVWGSSE